MANPRWQEGLNSWINAQLRKPRKPFQRDEAIAFDPLHRRGLGAADFAIPARIVELYDRGAGGMEGRGRGMRRTLQWRFTQGVSKPLVPQMLNKIKREVRRRHKINYRSAYVLLNVESGDYGLLYKHQQPLDDEIVTNERMVGRPGRASSSRRTTRETQHEMGFSKTPVC